MPGIKMAPEDVKHGTTAAANWHKKRGERPCEPCRLARNEYERKRRPVGTMISKTELKARLALSNRVLMHFSEKYPLEYRMIMDREVRKLQGRDE